MTQQEFDEKVQHTDKLAAEWISEFTNILTRIGVKDPELPKELCIKVLDSCFFNAVNDIETEYWRYVFDDISFYDENKNPDSNPIGGWELIEEKK